MSDQMVQSWRLTDMPVSNSGFRPMFSSPEAEPDGELEAEAPAPQDDPYANGLADGQEMAEAAFAVERRRLQAMIAAAQALQPEPSDELAVLIGETVEMLVSQIVGAATIDRELLNTRAKQAADLVAECDAARTIWLHPDDIELFDHNNLALEIMADPKADRGSIRIDCSAGWIEHGTALYLEQLRVELGLGSKHQ